MKEKELSVLIAIGELIIKHGVPAALRLLATINKVDITSEDILALRDRVPPPSFYEHMDSYEEGGEKDE